MVCSHYAPIIHCRQNLCRFQNFVYKEEHHQGNSHSNLSAVGIQVCKNEGSCLSSKESDNASLTSKISLLHNGHFQFKKSMGDQDLSLFKLMNKQCSSNVMENIFFFFYQFLWIVLCRILYRSSLPLPINAGMPQLIWHTLTHQPTWIHGHSFTMV